MVTHSSSDITTRLTRSVHASADRPRQLLAFGEAIQSPETHLKYGIERLLGAGGFGQVFLAKRAARSSVVPETVCIKVSTHIGGWLREAYFGQLLDGHPRAIRVYDTFPLLRTDGLTLYCLALEYACHGDLSAHLNHSEARAGPRRRRVARSRAFSKSSESSIADSSSTATSRR
jgi:serine/threonine protein kinase